MINETRLHFKIADLLKLDSKDVTATVRLLDEGGTIPFMSMLGEKFPSAQFLITGVLGPHSNAHGPNEFLHLDAAKRLTAAVASIVADVR
jgi:acetylornithine deacetylase/succinyl-diaminopimelate desuccinylase-like protein